jgi:hypothetical protein
MAALPGIALLLADQGEVERAVELYALASRYPALAESRYFADIAGRHLATAAEALPTDVVVGAQERGRMLDAEATVVALYLELKIALLLPSPFGRLGKPLARVLRPPLTAFLRRKYGQ